MVRHPRPRCRKVKVEMDEDLELFEVSDLCEPEPVYSRSFATSSSAVTRSLESIWTPGRWRRSDRTSWCDSSRRRSTIMCAGIRSM